MTTYKVTMVSQEQGKMPVISPFNIPKPKFDIIMAILHESGYKAKKGGYR
jgi:hypothetical protein